MKTVFLSISALLLVSACSTKQSKKDLQAIDFTQIDKELYGAKDPSDIDPLKPPTVILSSLLKGAEALKKPGPLQQQEEEALVIKLVSENSPAPVPAANEFHVRVQNYPLEAEWQTVKILVNGIYLGQLFPGQETLKITHQQLKPGLNTLFVYLTRPWGESVKSFTAIQEKKFFYIHTPLKKSSIKNEPSVYINLPRGLVTAEKATKLIFDVLVYPGELKETEIQKTELLYTLNSKSRKLPFKLAHYAFMNLAPGKYTLRIQIQNETKEMKPGPQSSHEVSFEIAPPLKPY